MGLFDRLGRKRAASGDDAVGKGTAAPLEGAPDVVGDIVAHLDGCVAALGSCGVEPDRADAYARRLNEIRLEVRGLNASDVINTSDLVTWLKRAFDATLPTLFREGAPSECADAIEVVGDSARTIRSSNPSEVKVASLRLAKLEQEALVVLYASQVLEFERKRDQSRREADRILVDASERAGASSSLDLTPAQRKEYERHLRDADLFENIAGSTRQKSSECYANITSLTASITIVEHNPNAAQDEEVARALQRMQEDLPKLFATMDEAIRDSVEREMRVTRVVDTGITQIERSLDEATMIPMPSRYQAKADEELARRAAELAAERKRAAEASEAVERAAQAWAQPQGAARLAQDQSAYAAWHDEQNDDEEPRRQAGKHWAMTE